MCPHLLADSSLNPEQAGGCREGAGHWGEIRLPLFYSALPKVLPTCINQILLYRDKCVELTAASPCNPRVMPVVLLAPSELYHLV